MPIANFAKEFPQRPGLVYLNHAAVAPWPERTARAVQAFAQENADFGAQRYPDWLETEAYLRDQLRILLNAPARDDIALVKNTSEGLSVIAWGLDWKPGDNVVVTEQEFPSNRVVWESLARVGVSTRRASLADGSAAEQAIFAACDHRTRLVSVSSVQYGTGFRLEVEEIGAFCRNAGILFCIDAIQTLGALPLDVQAAHADFVVADGHKWMLGPEGLAVFYCKPDVREALQLHQYGWHMVEHPSEFEREDWSVAGTARRFECGSPNMLGIHALSASLSLILEVGLDAISRKIFRNSSYIIDKIEETDSLQLLSSREIKRRSGIVTFQKKGADNGALVRKLVSRGIICAHRLGGIRFSPHFYIREEQLAMALDAVEHLQGD